MEAMLAHGAALAHLHTSDMIILAAAIATATARLLGQAYTKRTRH